jgi:class 3 adenylate cyclase
MTDNANPAADQLEQAQAELQLIRTVDSIRDGATDPVSLLTAVANILVERLSAQLCVVCLSDRETGDIDVKAVRVRGQLLSRLILAPEFVEWVRQVDDVITAKQTDLPPALAAVDPIASEPLHFVIVPICVSENLKLGALVLGRSGLAFGSADVAVLKAVESQLDSALVHVYAAFDLRQRTRELETIYRIDRIRDQHLPFDQMLSSVLLELCSAIRAEMGFIMLYDRKGHRLELRATTHDDLLRVAPHFAKIQEISNQALQRVDLTYHNDLGKPLDSIMCIPLILEREIIGVLGMVNRYGSAGFDQDDRRILRGIGSQMDTAIFESLERRRLRQVLGRSVDPHVMERLLENPDVSFLQGERMLLTVLYADVRRSTALSERTDPESLVGFINDYLSSMTDVILANEGTLDKFVGDEVMALFGAPFPQADHALRAVHVGLEMQKAHETVMERWRERGMIPEPIGVGIATGEMTAGEMGSAQRSDYTVIGPAANLGARICGIAQAGQVLISQATYELVKDRVSATPIAGLQLKGIDHPVTAYHIAAVL